MIQSNLQKENIYVSLRDLTNFKSEMRDKNGNDLQKAVQFLSNECKGVVHVFEESNVFQGLYFHTQEMHRSFKLYSDILFIDGTYKLSNLGLTVVILLVEDSQGRSEVVAIGLFVQEDRETYTEFLKIFKSSHSSDAIRKMKRIMSDKDMKKRGALSQLFPGIPLHICRFHTLQIFKRFLHNSIKDKDEKEKLSTIFRALVYSNSEQEYNENFKELYKSNSKTAINYFNKNWNGIKSEWTGFGMTTKNLGNMTNNKLESLNTKIKQVLGKQNTLIDFCKKLKQWLMSNNYENDLKVASCFTSRQLINNKDKFELQYMNHLTPYAYDLIANNFRRIEHLNINIINMESKLCSIKSKDIVLNITSNTCKCAFVKQYNLPGHRIFVVRLKFKMPFFVESLCDERWTKRFIEKKHRTFNNLVPDGLITNSEEASS